LGSAGRFGKSITSVIWGENGVVSQFHVLEVFDFVGGVVVWVWVWSVLLMSVDDFFHLLSEFVHNCANSKQSNDSADMVSENSMSESWGLPFSGSEGLVTSSEEEHGEEESKEADVVEGVKNGELVLGDWSVEP
jgi:hypothetical protein